MSSLERSVLKALIFGIICGAIFTVGYHLMDGIEWAAAFQKAIFPTLTYTVGVFVGSITG